MQAAVRHPHCHEGAAAGGDALVVECSPCRAGDALPALREEGAIPRWPTRVAALTGARPG